MRLRTFGIVTLAWLATTLLLAFGPDRAIATALARAPAAQAVGRSITWACEWLFLIPLSTYAWLALALAGAALLALRDRQVERARFVLFVAGSFWLTRLCVGPLKDFFARARPQVFLNGGEQTPDFFAIGFAEATSFPSGHAAFYFGWLVPLALLLPRWRWPLLGLGAVGALGRVLEGLHYPGDVLASAWLALLLALACARVLRIPLPRHGTAA